MIIWKTPVLFDVQSAQPGFTNGTTLSENQVMNVLIGSNLLQAVDWHCGDCLTYKTRILLHSI